MNSTRTGKKRATAFDPRLAIGLMLVAASVVGVVGIVSAADSSVQVYAARNPLAPGDRIRSGDLERRSVRLDAATGMYLTPGDIPDTGFVVTRPVSEGELIPASAVGSVDGLRLTAVVLTMGSRLAASVQAGSVVDVWAAEEIENSQFGPPAVIVAGATVVRLIESESIVAADQATAVEVLIPKARIARVLQSLANDAAISVVPVNLPGKN